MYAAIDIVGARHSGGSMVALETLRAAVAHPAVTRATVFASPDRDFALPTSPKLEIVDAPRASASAAVRFTWQLVGLHRAAASRGVDVVVGMSNGVVAIGNPRAVLFVQQALPLCPEAMRLMPPAFRMRLLAIREVMRVSVRTARLIAVQTDSTAAMLVNAFDVDPGRITKFTPAAPVIASEGFALQRMQSHPRGSLLLYVGNDGAYKNLETLVRAVEHLRQRRPEVRLFVTLPVGHPIASDSIVCLGGLNRAELRTAYEHADVVIMPSLVESLGLPLLEAMALGRPIVAADRPYAREVCSDAALYFAARSSEDLAAQVMRVLDDATARQRLIACGRILHDERSRVSAYSRMWDAIAAF